MNKKIHANTINRHFLNGIFLYFLATAIPGLFNIQTGSTKFYIFSSISLIIFIAWSLYFSMSKKISSGYFLRYFFIYTFLIIIFIFNSIANTNINMVSMISSAQPILSVVYLLIFFVLFRKTKLTLNGFNHYLRLFVYFMVFAGLYNILVNYQNILNFSTIINPYQYDFKSLFYNKNVFGYMLALGSASAIYLYSCLQKQNKEKKIYVFILVFLLLNLLLTLSRGGIIILLIFIIIYSIIKYRSRSIPIFFGITIIITCLVNTLGASFIQDNIIRSDEGTTGRDTLQSFALQRFSEINPLIGEGNKSIKIIDKKFGHSSYHSVYVETLMTQGLVGIVLLVMILGVIFRNILLIKNIDKGIYEFLLAFYIGYIIYCFIEALFLLNATPNSVITTILLLYFPRYILNSAQNKERIS